jgi:hypothetical protein
MLRIIFTLVAFVLHVFAFAHGYVAGDLRIGHPTARVTKPGQTSGAAYLTIENNGKQIDKLIAASAAIASSTQLHSMAMDGNVMRMREVADIEIQPGTKVMLRPGDGYHIMLLGLKKPLNAGDKFPLTLTFEKIGKVEVSVWVEDKAVDQSKPTKDASSHAQHH